MYYEEHEGEKSAANVKNILMIPTISDVSTVEEWRAVAKNIVARDGEVQCRVTIVDWPGLGYSDRPSLNYNADVMENFLVQFMNAPDSPLANLGKNLPFQLAYVLPVQSIVSHSCVRCSVIIIYEFSMQCSLQPSIVTSSFSLHVGLSTLLSV